MISEELHNKVKSIASSPKFINSSPEEREDMLVYIADEYVKYDPAANQDEIRGYVAGMNKTIRRDLGEGRKTFDLSQLNIELPTQDPSWGIYSEDEKVKRVDDWRGTIEEKRNLDPLNSDDLDFYLHRTADQMQRYAQGEDTTWFGDKGRRITAGFVAGLGNYLGADKFANDVNIWFETNPEMDADFSSKLAQGIGDFGASTAVYLGATLLAAPLGPAAPYVGTSAVLAGNSIARYNEAYNQAIDLGMNAAQADDAGWGAIPGAAVDVIGDSLLAGRVGKILPGGWKNIFIKGSIPAKREALKQMAKDTTFRREMMLAARDMFAEGASEALGDYTAGYGAYLQTGERDFIPSQDELTDSFLIGAILGGTVGGISVLKDTTRTLTEEDGKIKKGFVSKTGQQYAAIEQSLAQRIDGTYSDPREGDERIKFSSEVFAKLGEGDIKGALELSKRALNLGELDQTTLPNYAKPGPIKPDEEGTYEKFFAGLEDREEGDYRKIYETANGTPLSDDAAAKINQHGKQLDELARRRAAIAEAGKPTEAIEAVMAKVVDRMNAVATNDSVRQAKTSTDVSDILVTKHGVFEDEQVTQNKVAELNKKSKDFRYGYNKNPEGYFEIYKQRKPVENLGEVMGRAADVNAAFNYRSHVLDFMVAAENASQTRSTADFHASTIDKLLGIGQESDQTKFLREQQPVAETISPEEALANVERNQLVVPVDKALGIESQHTGSTLVGAAADWTTANDIRQSFLARGEIVSIRENEERGEYEIYTEQFQDYTPTPKSAEESANAIQEETPKSASQSASVIQRYYEMKSSDEELGADVEYELTNRDKKLQARNRSKGMKPGSVPFLVPSLKDLADIGTNISEVAKEAAAAFNSGLQNFASWSKAMLSKFGEGIRKFLRGLWEALGDGLIRYMERTGSLMRLNPEEGEDFRNSNSNNDELNRLKNDPKFMAWYKKFQERVDKVAKQIKEDAPDLVIGSTVYSTSGLPMKYLGPFPRTKDGRKRVMVSYEDNSGATTKSSFYLDGILVDPPTREEALVNIINDRISSNPDVYSKGRVIKKAKDSNDPAQRLEMETTASNFARKYAHNKYTQEEINNAIAAKRLIDGYEDPVDQPNIKSPQVGYSLGDGGTGADTVKRRMSPQRGTGHFGTGTYFLGKDAVKPAQELFLGGRKDRPVTEINLDGLNLYKPSVPQHAHDYLRKINQFVYSEGNTKDKFGRQMTKEHLIDDSELIIMRKSSEDASRALGEAQRAFKDESDIRSPSTVFMQELGFDGVDVTGTDFDNTEYGSVVYVARPFQPNETRQLNADLNILQRIKDCLNKPTK